MNCAERVGLPWPTFPVHQPKEVAKGGNAMHTKRFKACEYCGLSVVYPRTTTRFCSKKCRGQSSFWSHVEKGENCWLWTGCLDKDGYGHTGVVIDGKFVGSRSHCIVYEAAKGPVPKGLILDHLCRNRACVRPDHMEPVTILVNNFRGAQFRRSLMASA